MSDQITEEQRAFFLKQANDRQEWAAENSIGAVTVHDLVVWQADRIKKLEAENETLRFEVSTCLNCRHVLDRLDKPDIGVTRRNTMQTDNGWQYEVRDGVPIYRKSDSTNTVSVCVYQRQRNGESLDSWQVDWEEANGDVDGYPCATKKRALEEAEKILSEMIRELQSQ